MGYTLRSDNSKTSEVKEMFNSIARRYDFLNHLLSFGIDISWRMRLIRELKKHNPSLVLDVATGTADLAIMATAAGIGKIFGIDLSEEMVAIGQKKIKKRRIENKVELLVANAENIPFPDKVFDAAMVAFGVRNFEHLHETLIEMRRVLKENAPLFVLEFSKPTCFPVKQLYRLYSFRLIPLIGKMVSRDQGAYSYLPGSIALFPSGNDFLGIMELAGFTSCSEKRFTFGIATLYTGFRE